MLSVVYSEFQLCCRKSALYAEYRYAECRYTEYLIWRDKKLFMLSVTQSFLIQLKYNCNIFQKRFKSLERF